MITKRLYYSPLWGTENPFHHLEQVRREWGRLFDRLATHPSLPSEAGVFPLINLTEDMDSYYVRAELPGFSENELEITATGNNLSLSGERKILSAGDNVGDYGPTTGYI